MKARFVCQSIGLVATLVLPLSGCGEAESEARLQALELEDVASYWAVRGKDSEENNYIHPVVRFRVRNGGREAVGYVQAMAVFKRESFPEEPWGNAFLYSISEVAIPPGGSSDVLTLRADTNFVSKDAPELMFENEKWEEVRVEVFLRVGASSWKAAAQLDVPKRIGAPGLEKFLEPSANPDPPPVVPGEP